VVRSVPIGLGIAAIFAPRLLMWVAAVRDRAHLPVPGPRQGGGRPTLGVC